MLVKDLVVNGLAIADGSVVNSENLTLNGVFGYSGIVQAKVAGTATVKLQGRMSSAFDWVDLATFTASGSSEVFLMPEMRYSITAWSSGGVWMTLMLSRR
jgi:hypothetical protein